MQLQGSTYAVTQSQGNTFSQYLEDSFCKTRVFSEIYGSRIYYFAYKNNISNGSQNEYLPYSQGNYNLFP